jgi:hypothetical protein
MSVFTVSTGDAASFQEHYQCLIDAWFREFLDSERSQLQHPDQKKLEIRVTDNERVVYGRIDKEFRNELTPKLIEQIEKLRATPVGGVVKSIGSKTIEVDGQVVLQSDRTGKVIVNSVLEIEQSLTVYLARVNAITKALSQYAQATGSRVQVNGKLAYKWLATPDGRVRIDAKDGRGVLLVQAQGQLRCRMHDRDLAHFEQMLPVLKSARSRSKTVDWERN